MCTWFYTMCICVYKSDAYFFIYIKIINFTDILSFKFFPHISPKNKKKIAEKSKQIK